MTLLRLCEWGRRHVPAAVDEEARGALAAAAEGWRVANRLPFRPLHFEGADGRTLRAGPYVGVVEAAGVTVEIFPKLDRELLDRETVDSDDRAGSVLRSLLYLLEASGYSGAAEAGTGGLDDAPDRFLDLFAWLLAKNLRLELGRGLARRYERREEDLRGAVRGRILVGAQGTRNLDRFDRIACAWDEFTADTPVNRLLRCACRTVARRVRDPRTRAGLTDCALVLEEAEEVAPVVALREAAAQGRRWDRSTARFRRSFDLACRLLEGAVHAPERGAADTFVFLLDMNSVFESFVRAALEDAFATAVFEQVDLGKLLPDLARGSIRQKADFVWTGTDGGRWIGDAKYKRLAGGDNALRFVDLPDVSEGEDAPAGERDVIAGRVLSPDDVRQLTVYAELERRRPGASAETPTVAIFYPFVGSGTFAADAAKAWNGSRLFLVPVRVGHPEGASGWERPAAQALPGGFFGPPGVTLV